MIDQVSPEKFEQGLFISTGIFSVIFLLDKFHLVNLGTSTLNDNFIRQIYGHSYLADLVVLTFPFLISQLGQKKIKGQLISSNFLLLFFFIILILTNSRSGVIAVIIGILFLKSNNRIQKSVKATTITISIILLLISAAPAYQNKFDKTTTGERNTYWTLAFNGFLESPLFGNGPNTFPVIRKENQTQPTNTNLVHSSIISFLCENGIIFTLLFFILIFYGLRENQKHNNLFFTASIIAVIHSLLDPTWSSPGIFIISLYLIFYYSNIFKKDFPKKQNSFPLVFSLALLCFIFFILDTLSTHFLIKKDYQTSLIFNPFNLDSRLGIISSTNPKSENWQKNLQFTLKYFPKNEIVYQGLIKTIPFPQNEEYYYQLFNLNPKESLSYYQELIEKIKNINDDAKLEKILSYIDNHFKENETKSRLAISLSKESYDYAIKVYPNNPEKSVIYFRLAVKLFPISGFYQVDLANALWYSNQIEAATNQLSNNCQDYSQAKDQCQNYLQGHQTKSFNQPGSKEYVDYINENYN